MPVLIRVKGATTGYIYIRKGTPNLQLRPRATRFPTHTAASDYVRRARLDPTRFVLTK